MPGSPQGCSWRHWSRSLPAGTHPPAIVMAATVTLLVLGVIDTTQAFAGLLQPCALDRGGAVRGRTCRAEDRDDDAAHRQAPGGSPGTTALARLVVPTAGASAFLNNTPLVAMLIPDVIAWTRRQHLSASKFLLPLSYATILGGTVTVLGTSTTLVVSGLVEETGQEPFGVFEVTKVGGPVAIAGLLTLVLVSSRLVPPG